MAAASPLLSLAIEALAETGPHIVTVVSEIPPGAARVYTHADGTMMIIQSLYDPDERPLWCVLCGRVTVHKTATGRKPECLRCKKQKKGAR